MGPCGTGDCGLSFFRGRRGVLQQRGEELPQVSLGDILVADVHHTQPEALQDLVALGVGFDLRVVNRPVDLNNDLVL